MQQYGGEERSSAELELSTDFAKFNSACSSLKVTCSAFTFFVDKHPNFMSTTHGVFILYTHLA